MGLREQAQALRREALTVWVAARDPRTPLIAKMLAGVVAAYAFSPIDLIPDFIPILGWLDDILLVPIGVWAVFKLIPDPLIADYRAAADAMAERPLSAGAAAVIVALWLAGCAGVALLVLR